MAQQGKHWNSQVRPALTMAPRPLAPADALVIAQMRRRVRLLRALRALVEYAVWGLALATLALRHTETGAEETLETAGAFIAIGHVPTSNLVEGQIALNGDGYVEVDGRSTRTNRPGVFGAGDLVDHTYRQAITAAASGCQAAVLVRRASEPPCPAHEAALETLGIRVLGEVETFSAADPREGVSS